MNRTWGRIKPEIGKEQCGFVKDSGTENEIFIFRIYKTKSNNN